MYILCAICHYKQPEWLHMESHFGLVLLQCIGGLLCIAMRPISGVALNQGSVGCRHMKIGFKDNVFRRNQRVEVSEVFGKSDYFDLRKGPLRDRRSWKLLQILEILETSGQVSVSRCSSCCHDWFGLPMRLYVSHASTCPVHVSRCRGLQGNTSCW